MTSKFINTYDDGLPFHHSLKDSVIEPCIKNLNRQPKILIIDGSPGTGKTTLGVHILDHINGAQVDLATDTPQIALGGKDLIEKSEICAGLGYKAIIYDEADLDKRGALTKFNNLLFGYFREYRSLGIMIILIIQNVEWLDNRLWSLGAVVGLIHLSKPTKNYTSYDVYDLENMSYLLERMEKLGRFKSIKAYSICKGYMRGQFLNLDSKRELLLRNLSDLQKKKSRKTRLKKI